MKKLLLLLSVVFPSFERRRRISCKDMDGNNVDWFVAIKLPAGVTEEHGLSFVYTDPFQKNWVLSDLLLDDRDSAIGATVDQLYSTTKSLFKIAYSDQPPGEKSNSRAHSKGVSVFDHRQGFWLIHSVPKFPFPDEYGYPDTGQKFAQSFMCVTLSVDALEPMSQFMRYAQVTPYMYDVPKYYFKIAPYLDDVLNKKSLRRSERNFYTINDLTTLNGQRLTMFSKHKKFGKDLWYGLIAPFYATNMAVESWRNGAAKDVGTTCGINENVYDVEKVKVLAAEFDNSLDHSKWGVSMHKNASIACVGGINRQYSQYKRGGGAVCIDNIRLWNTLLNSVDEYTDCGF